SLGLAEVHQLEALGAPFAAACADADLFARHRAPALLGCEPGALHHLDHLIAGGRAEALDAERVEGARRDGDALLPGDAIADVEARQAAPVLESEARPPALGDEEL